MFLFIVDTIEPLLSEKYTLTHWGSVVSGSNNIKRHNYVHSSMFGSIGRLVRCQKCVASLVRWKATRLPKVADITNAQFWEEDTRPIPNVSDSVVHVVTQDNEHINWERSHHKVKLVGVVQNAARRIGFGLGQAVQFTLKTSTVLEQEGGYLVLEDLHEVVVLQEMTRRVALFCLRPGVSVLVVASVHSRLNHDRGSVFSYIKSNLFLEHFDTLDRANSNL